jgi:diadenosine tetraphosphate (Ap4A) HIT family hydrolase
MPNACLVCSINDRLPDLSPRDALLVEGVWRVAHTFDTSLPGWLVLVPMRHVTALEDLSPEEAQPLGLLLHRLSAALRAVTGCSKSYFMFFAEAEGFSHFHVHLVPRMPTFTEEQTGPEVFTFLRAPEPEQVPEQERDLIALRLRAALEAR